MCYVSEKAAYKRHFLRLHTAQTLNRLGFFYPLPQKNGSQQCIAANQGRLFLWSFVMSNRLIRLPEVILKTGLGRAAIYAKLDSKNRRYDPTFPRSVPLTTNRVAWVEHEVDEWINTRIAQRDQQAKGA